MTTLETVLLAIAIATSISLLVALRRRPVTAPVEPAATPRVRTTQHLLGNPAELLEVLGRMSEGLLVLDQSQRIIYANRSARSLLGIAEASLPARPPIRDIATLGKRVAEQDLPNESTIELFFPERRTLVLRATPFTDTDNVLVLVGDVSQQVAANRIRKEFVSHASHELKSPVAGMRSLAEALDQAISSKDEPGAKKLLGSLLEDLERLSALVTDLLDLSQIEEGSQRSKEPVDLSTLARREVASFADDAERNGSTIIGPDDTPVVVKDADPLQIGLMIRNLLENAIRYTPEGGRISVSIRNDGKRAHLTVADEGMGIPQEAQPRIFERFYRVDKARSRHRGGTGLGLAIVKHVAELHNGSVEVESELGSGSRFTVILPVETEEGA